METNTPKLAVMLMMLSGMLFSCNKKDNDGPGCAINMENLSGSYKLTAVQYKPSPSAAPQDYLGLMDDCQKDDILILKSDGSLNGTIASYDCKTMVYYIGNSLVPGDRFTFTMERQ